MKKTNVLLLALTLLGSVFFLTGCQDDLDGAAELHTRAEKVEHYADIFWSDRSEDLVNKDLENKLFEFMSTLSLEELDRWYDVGMVVVGSPQTDLASKEKVMKIHRQAFDLRGVNAFGLNDEQLDALNENGENMQSYRSSCPAYYFPIPCTTNYTASWSCIDVESVTNPADSDCDWGLTFYVGPMNPSATLKLRGTNWRARQMISMGGINSRHYNLKRQILVGKGKVNVFYPFTGVNGFKNDVKAGLGFLHLI